MSLPKSRLEHYRRFLADLGLTVGTATALHKILWLQSLLTSPTPIRHKSFVKLATNVALLGKPDTKAFDLVHAYAYELRSDRRFLAPGAPAEIMPANILRQVLALGHSRQYHTLARQRVRDRFQLALKLVWCTGISNTELRAVRRGWLDPQKRGINLNVQSAFQTRKRVIPIPFADDDLSVGYDLRDWLSIMPEDPDAFVFPPSTQLLGSTWDKPGERMFPMGRLFERLKALGERRYCLMSLRRHFFKRTIEVLGLPLALYLSGYSSIGVLQHALRGEPAWPRNRSILG